MKNLRNLLTIISLVAILNLGALTAKAGLLVSDFSGNTPTSQPCEETKVDAQEIKESSKINSGIIVHLTGIISHLTGIIIHVVETDENTNCGIIVHD